MSSISSVTGSASTAVDASAATATKKTLTTQDFLQLLSTQLQNQDPLKPMDDTAYLAQMAQFTSLEQMNTLSGQVTLLRSDQQQLAAVSYLGRTVTMDDGKSSTISGPVTDVNTASSPPQLKVNGTYYPLTALLSVAPTPTPTTTTTSATSSNN